MMSIITSFGVRMGRRGSVGVGRFVGGSGRLRSFVGGVGVMFRWRRGILGICRSRGWRVNSVLRIRSGG